MLWTMKTSWAMFAGREGISTSRKQVPNVDDILGVVTALARLAAKVGSETGKRWSFMASTGRRVEETRVVKLWVGGPEKPAGRVAGVNLVGIGGEGGVMKTGVLHGAEIERVDSTVTSTVKGPSWKLAREGTRLTRKYRLDSPPKVLKRTVKCAPSHNFRVSEAAGWMIFAWNLMIIPKVGLT